MSTITNKEKAQRIYGKMMKTDRFTAWMGLKLDEIDEGSCQMHYILRQDMLNGFNTAHGGVLFAASDSAFAFACNSHGLVTVALEASIHYLRPVVAEERLSVCAKLIHLGGRTGLYEVSTINEKGELVCLFKGTAYRSKKAALS